MRNKQRYSFLEATVHFYYPDENAGALGGRRRQIDAAVLNESLSVCQSPLIKAADVSTLLINAAFAPLDLSFCSFISL